MRTLNYTLEPGHPWERLIMVKDKRTRRPRKVKTAEAKMVLRSDPTEVFFPTITISYEGGISLCISHEDSYILEAGIWDFSVVGDFRGFTEPLAHGTIEVAELVGVIDHALSGIIITRGEAVDITFYKWTDASETVPADWPLGTLSSNLRATLDDDSTVILPFTVDVTNRDAVNGGAVVLSLTNIQTGSIPAEYTSAWFDIIVDGSEDLIALDALKVYISG